MPTPWYKSPVLASWAAVALVVGMNAVGWVRHDNTIDTAVTTVQADMKAVREDISLAKSADSLLVEFSRGNSARITRDSMRIAVLERWLNIRRQMSGGTQ